MPEEISKEYLKEKQYKSTQYLEARIKIHQFTKNKIGFHEWIFDQYDLSGFDGQERIYRSRAFLFWSKHNCFIVSDGFSNIWTIGSFFFLSISSIPETMHPVETPKY